MKNMKAYLLAALFAVVASVGVISGYNTYQATKLHDTEVNDIKLNGNDILDSTGTIRITVGEYNVISGNMSVSSNTTLSGLLTVSSSTVITGSLGAGKFYIASSTSPRDASVGVTPIYAGQFIYNSTDREICYSTGTSYMTWVRTSSTTVTACSH